MVEDLIREVHRLKRKAERARDIRAAIKGLDTALKGIEVLAKLTGELDTRAQHNSLHVHLDAERALAIAETYAARHRVQPGTAHRSPTMPTGG